MKRLPLYPLKKLAGLWLFVSIVFAQSVYAQISPSAGNILYVNHHVSGGTGSGNNWGNAIRELADALKWAYDNKHSGIWDERKPLQIWVAEGIYRPQYSPESGLPHSPADPKSRAFLMLENVAIYGGFPNTGNPVMSDRNWGEHVTLLDGDNAYHVVVAVNSVSMEARLDGFSITGGHADGNPADPLTVNGTSVAKADGGGIYCHNSYFDFFNLHIYANSASRSGGGIYIHAGTIELTNVLISNNTATEGGGMKVSDSFSQFTNVTVSRNTADHGGGIHATGEPASICENSIIYGNNAPDAANVYTTWINGNRLSFDYSLIGEPSGSMTSDEPDYNGNIMTAVNPFADMDHDNFALRFRSIAIDKGKDSEYDVSKSGDKDLAGKPRVYGMAIDMGAYERQPPVLNYMPSTGNILYVNERVDQVAPGYIQDGSSWANAIPELADALKWAAINKAEWAGQPLKLYVAAGTYKPLYSPEDGAGFVDDGRNNTFLLIEDVQLYGGFPAMGDPTIGDRDWVANETILDGDNRYHVVVSAGEAGTARLDGFTVTDGNADGESSHFITINGRGVAPVSGGGIAISGASPGLFNLNIHSNSASNSGGGVYNESGAPRMINGIVSSNRSTSGGGMYTYAGSPILTNVVISNNTADEHGGGMVSGTYASAVLTNVTIVGNTAGVDGGGIYNDLSSFVAPAPTTAFYNCLFLGNMAGHSGNDLHNRRNIGDNSGTPFFTNSLVGGHATWQAAWGTNVGGSSMATTVNPFMDMAGGDYTLHYDSDAVDGGSNVAYDEDEYGGKDLAGNPRMYKGTIDIGAYEFQGVPIAPTDNILYVKKGGVGSQSGDSWGNAIAELADALKWAREQHDAGTGWNQDNPLQIWVAGGSYQPRYHAADGKYGTDGGRHNSFVLVPNVQLYGGFDPDNGIDDLTDERLLPDVSSGESEGTVLAGDNAYHVVISAKPVGEARLDGFSITGGNAEGSAFIGVNSKSISPRRGGGMYMDNSSPTLANVGIHDNVAYDSGGGLYHVNASPKLVHVSINDNVVTGSNSYGGGVDNDASSPIMDHVHISGNSSNRDGGGLSSRNGSSPVLTRVYITGNSAGSGETSVTYGGGIYNSSASPVLINVEISDNTATFGGGIYNRASAARLRNVVISGNRATSAGGVYNEIAAATGALTLTNVTVSGNIATINAFAGEWYNSTITPSIPIIRNSIIYGNGIVGNLTNSQYSLLQGISNTDNGNLNYTGAVGDLFAAPADGDYGLLACSPAVDSGNNTVYEDADGDLEQDSDLAEGPRVVGDVIDMGAYELQDEKIDYDQIAFTAAEVTYNRTAHTITATNLPTGISVSYELFNAEDEEITEAIHVGTYTVKATFSGCGPERQLSARLTILPKELIITAKDRSKIYGDAVAFDGTAFTVDGLENDDAVVSVTLASAGAAATAAVGQYDIAASDAQGTGLDNYAIDYEEGTLTVDKKALTITADNRSKTYGEAIAFDGTAFTVDGLENDDKVTSVTLTSDAATASAVVGEYDIVASEAQGTGLDNYAIDYEEGTLTVDKKALTITADNRSKTYGEAIAFDGTAFTVDGLENDDKVTSVTLTSDAAAASAAVGDYGVVAADAQGIGLANYDIEYVMGVLTVDRKALTIIADNRSKTYGEVIAFDGTAFTVDGLENDDKVTSVALASAGAAATAAVGNYDIVATNARGAGLDNYEIDYEEGTLAVDKKALTITASDQSKTYGEAVAFDDTEFTASGLENDDAVTSVTLTSDGAAAVATVDEYDIVAADAQGTGLANYDIIYVKGALVVEKKPLTIAAKDGSKTYGEEVVFDGTEFTADGLENNDAVTSVALTSDGAAATAAVDEYGIVATDAQGTGLDNYAIDYEEGTLAVDKKPLTITARDRSKTYGEVVAFDSTAFTADGLENDDEITSIALLSDGEVASAAAGNYTIEVSDARGTGLGNYDVRYVKGMLNVGKKRLTVTATRQNKTYGESVALDGTAFTAAGLENSDAVAGVTLVSAGAVATAIVANYVIEVSDAQGIGLANYNIEYKKGTLTVGKKTLTVTAVDQSKTYGETIAFAGTEFTVSGLENDDEITYVALTSDGAAAMAVVGDYDIEVSRVQGTRLGNYRIDYERGTLTVGKRPLTVTVVEGQQKIFGQTDPQLTYTVTAGLVEGDSVTGSLARNPGEHVGEYEITQGSLSAGTNYEIAFVSDIFTITPAALTDIELNNLTVTYDGFRHSLFVSGAPDGATVTYTGNGQVGAGTYTVTALVQKTNHNDLELSATLVIGKATRSIAFPELPGKVYGDADFAPGATASSGEAVNYVSSDPMVAEITADGLIRIIGAGTTTIAVTVADNPNYTDRPEASQVLMVRSASQTITLSAPAEADRDAGTVAITATASSGLPVSLSIDDPEVATLNGTVLNILRLGTVRITATQSGDDNHEAAEAVTVTVRVTDPDADFPVRVNKAVSPNGDGINEYLIIEGIKHHPDNRVRIFNRNGTIVWEASGYDNDRVAFRGMGTGQHSVPAGTYFYVAEIKIDGEWKYEKGWFVLRY